MLAHRCGVRLAYGLTAVPARWRDVQSALGLTAVLARRRNFESEAKLMAVLACCLLGQRRVGGGANGGARLLACWLDDKSAARRMVVLACWLDEELEARQMAVLSHRRNVESAVWLTVVLACWRNLTAVLAHQRNVKSGAELTVVVARL